MVVLDVSASMMTAACARDAAAADAHADSPSLFVGRHLQNVIAVARAHAGARRGGVYK